MWSKRKLTMVMRMPYVKPQAKWQYGRPMFWCGAIKHTYIHHILGNAFLVLQMLEKEVIFRKEAMSTIYIPSWTMEEQTTWWFMKNFPTMQYGNICQKYSSATDLQTVCVEKYLLKTWWCGKSTWTPVPRKCKKGKITYLMFSKGDMGYHPNLQSKT